MCFEKKIFVDRRIVIRFFATTRTEFESEAFFFCACAVLSFARLVLNILHTQVDIFYTIVVLLFTREKQYTKL